MKIETAVMNKLFPTWVGVILMVADEMRRSKAFPHMGGGDPKGKESEDYEDDFSPHGWG